jgi:very-short-patch-repair endonuclease
MNPIQHAADSWGVVLRRDALACGLNDRVLYRLVRDGTLVRLRQGVYALRSTYLAADDKTRHLMLCRAVMRLYAGHVVLSHGSAAMASGGPDYGLDLINAHVTHLDGGGRNKARVVHHQGACLVGDLRRQDGHWITTPARTVLDVAGVSGAEAGLVQANHVLHLELTTMSELHSVAQAVEFWPRTLPHHLVLHLAEPKVESVGETRSMFLFSSQGLPRPEPQFEIQLPHGEVARVDFAWPELKVIVEFDGAEKYHRHRRPGETIEQMVMREKRREDLIREVTGWTVIRLIWKDLDVPVATALRIRRAMANTAA